MPGLVQGLHHLLELRGSGARPLVGGIRAVRGEIADGVIAPVVAQPLVQQVLVVDEIMHRHQFDRRDTQLLQVVYRFRMSEPRIGSSQFRRDTGMAC